MNASPSLTRLALLLALLGFLPVGPSSVIAADEGDELVKMCHRGVTITVQRRFVAQRLQLGDTLGECDCCGTRQGVVFDKEIYTVAPGEEFVAQVCICPAPPTGLFSYGVEVTLEGGNFSGTGFAASIPPELDFHTVRGLGADTAAGPQSLLAKGSVDFFKEPLALHRSTMIASFRLPGLPAGSYALSLKPRNDLGPTEQIFIDGDGTVLDDVLQFLPSSVVVQAPNPLLASGAQDGQFFQRYTLTNPFATEQRGLRVLLRNLPAGITVLNASGSVSGVPYLSYTNALAPGASVQLTIEYALADESVQPAPQFEVQDAAGLPFPLTAVFGRPLSTGGVTVEFNTESGRQYFVQYSRDLKNWTTVLPAFKGTGSTLQWLDEGPPKTDSRPPETGLRFYRLHGIKP